MEAGAQREQFHVEAGEQTLCALAGDAPVAGLLQAQVDTEGESFLGGTMADRVLAGEERGMRGQGPA